MEVEFNSITIPSLAIETTSVYPIKDTVILSPALAVFKLNVPSSPVVTLPFSVVTVAPDKTSLDVWSITLPLI